jgi:hypothetical protein
MQVIPLAALILVCLSTAAGCVSRDQGPVFQPTVATVTASVSLVPATIGTGTPSMTIPGTKLPTPGQTPPSPWGDLQLSPAGPYHSGDRIRISANTILSPGNPILIEVLSAGFDPTNKMNDTRFYGTSAVVNVEKGIQDSNNRWSSDLDTTGYAPGLYQVQVSALLVRGYRLSGSFVLLPG